MAIDYREIKQAELDHHQDRGADDWESGAVAQPPTGDRDQDYGMVGTRLQLGAVCADDGGDPDTGWIDIITGPGFAVAATVERGGRWTGGDDAALRLSLTPNEARKVGRALIAGADVAEGR